MAEFPALPLFTDAYLADTRHLSTLQHGAYCLLLMTAWRAADCALPDDDIMLARITGMDRRTWLKNKAILLAFWERNEQHKWIQKRLLDERIYVEQKRNKNANAGRASALKRKNRGSTTVQPKINQTPTPTLTPSKEEANASSPPTPKPPKVTLDSLSVDHVADWLAKKRTEGRYRDHDEHFVLEYFKNYCLSKGRKYANYVAGYRNAFEWERCQPAGRTGQVTKSDRAKAAVIRAAVAGGFASSAESNGAASVGDQALP